MPAGGFTMFCLKPYFAKSCEISLCCCAGALVAAKQIETSARATATRPEYRSALRCSPRGAARSRIRMRTVNRHLRFGQARDVIGAEAKIIFEELRRITREPRRKRNFLIFLGGKSDQDARRLRTH